MKLSILICHLPQRVVFLNRLFAILDPQIDPDQVEVLVDERPKTKIGRKRNDLLQGARGEYLCFIDDDDMVSDNYISLLMEGINKGVDCCSLLGQITTDGINPYLFEHSIKYKAYCTNQNGQRIKYERYPNHLNCIKSSIAKQFYFPEKNHGEDTAFATKIFESGLLKSEHYIPEILYFYDYRSNK